MLQLCFLSLIGSMNICSNKAGSQRVHTSVIAIFLHSFVVQDETLATIIEIGGCHSSSLSFLVARVLLNS